jgi:hypothetical protein
MHQNSARQRTNEPTKGMKCVLKEKLMNQPRVS